MSEGLGKINNRAVGGTDAPNPGFKFGTASLAGFRETTSSRVDKPTLYEATAETSMSKNVVTADISVFRITNDQEIQEYPKQ